MPHLALITSKFFLSLSKYCLTFYHQQVKEQKNMEKDKELGLSAKLRTYNNENAPSKKPLTAYIIYFQDRISSFQK